MLDDWDEFLRRHPKKLKSRLEKGIPDNLRGMAWKVLTNSDELMERNRGKYEELCTVTDVPLADTIARDIHRTFPDHVMFRGGKDSVGQTSLHQLLRAYSGAGKYMFHTPMWTNLLSTSHQYTIMKWATAKGWATYRACFCHICRRRRLFGSSNYGSGWGALIKER